MSLYSGLIMKTVDILPICPTLRQMWKKTVSDNKVWFIVNGEASELITIMRGVAQGNTISPVSPILYSHVYLLTKITNTSILCFIE